MEIGWIGRQILNGSQGFFLYNILIFINFFKYESIETHARAFLSLIILAVGTVQSIEIRGAIRIGYVDQPNILVPLICMRSSEEVL